MKDLVLKIKTMFVGLFIKKEVVSHSNKNKRFPLNLQFFAEPPTDQDPSADHSADPPKQDSKEEPPADDSKQKEHMIPKSRFDEINNNYKTVKDQLDELLKEKDEADRQAREKQGEYQSLYEEASQERDTYKTDAESNKTRVEALEGIITSMLNSRLEAIPEEFHDLIPGNLSPEQKLDWISKAEAKGFFKDKSQEPVGGATNPPAGKADFDNMSTDQLLRFGYGNKK